MVFYETGSDSPPKTFLSCGTRTNQLGFPPLDRISPPSLIAAVSQIPPKQDGLAVERIAENYLIDFYTVRKGAKDIGIR